MQLDAATRPHMMTEPQRRTIRHHDGKLVLTATSPDGARWSFTWHKPS